MLKILDREISGRIAVLDVEVLPYEMLQTVYALLQLGSMIDVDVTGQTRIALLVDLDYGVEQMLYTLSAAAHRRHHGHSEKVA